MQPILFVLGAVMLIAGLLQLVRKKSILGFLFSGLGFLSIIIAFVSAPKGEIPSSENEVYIRILGSKTIGGQLMPDLIIDFFEAKDYHLIAKDENSLRIIYTAKSETLNQVLKIEIAAIGSILGFEALAEEQCEIAMASDKIDSLMIAKLGQRFDAHLHEHVIAYDAVQIIVHPAIGEKLGHISKEHLRALLHGELIDWKELHPDIQGKIKVVLRDSSSGTSHFMKESILPNDSIRSDAIRLDYFEKIASFVETDSLAIGFVNYAIDTLHLQQVSILSIVNEAGISIRPTMKTIQDNSYPLSRKLYLYTSNRKDKNALIQSIIQFCKSPIAIEEVRRDGLIPFARIQ